MGTRRERVIFAATDNLSPAMLRMARQEVRQAGGELGRGHPARVRRTLSSAQARGHAGIQVEYRDWETDRKSVV